MSSPENSAIDNPNEFILASRWMSLTEPDGTTTTFSMNQDRHEPTIYMHPNTEEGRQE